MRARELKEVYLWVRKTLACALGLQGRVEQEYAVLFETLEVAESVFGRTSLPALHAVFLLQKVNGRDGNGGMCAGRGCRWA